MEVLSQSQIDDLLKSLTPGGGGSDEKEDSAPAKPAKKIKEYDFRSPKRFTKEHLKIISNVGENYSRHISSYLTSLLRLYVSVECVQIEEQRYSEFNNALPDMIMTGVGEMRFSGSNEEDNLIMLDVARPVAFCIIERLLGGAGDGLDVQREFSEIESSIMEGIFKGMFPQMTDAWSKYMEVDALYRKMETNARLMQDISPDDIVVIMALEVAIKDITGAISICIPAVCMENAIKKVNAQTGRNTRRIQSAGDKERRDQVMDYMHQSDLEIKCVIGKTKVNLSDILYLNVGDVIQLGKPTESLVELCVGESCWFKGKMGLHRAKKAVQVSEVL